MSTPQLVGAVQCSCEYLARLQEFVIVQAQSSLSCAQGPQSLTGGGVAACGSSLHLSFVFVMYVCVHMCMYVCVQVHVCVYIYTYVCVRTKCLSESKCLPLSAGANLLGDVSHLTHVQLEEIGVGLNASILWEEALHSALMPVTPQASMGSLSDSTFNQGIGGGEEGYDCPLSLTYCSWDGTSAFLPG